MDRLREQVKVKKASHLSLEETFREGARKLLLAALQSEIEAYVERFKEHKNEKGRCAVVKNGTSRERTILTGIGP